MAHKTSPARVEAFFRALGETGNQTIAAERARVTRQWAQLRRKADPDFAARMAATIAVAREQLRAARALEPTGAAWRAQAGEELVVRGSGERLIQIRRARLGDWTPRLEARFLAALAACCNVSAAARAVGLSVSAAYQHYHRWPDFERRWEEALKEGYVRLEMALLESAGRAFEPVDYPPDVPIEPMTVHQAMTLLAQHQARVHKIGQRPGRTRRYARNPDEVFESLARKLDRLAHKLTAEAAPDPAGARRDLDRGAKVVRGG